MDSWKGISSQHSHRRRPSCYHKSQFFFQQTSLSFSMNCSVVSCTAGLAFRTAFAPIVWTGGTRRVNVIERFPLYACGF